MAEYALLVGGSVSSAATALGDWSSQNDLLLTVLGGAAIMIFACAMLFRR